MDNPDGRERSRDEAKALAKKFGVEIPDDIELIVVEEGSLGPGVWANYPTIRDDGTGRVKWADFCRADGKLVVRLDRSIMKSDEGIVAALGHEMHELNALRNRFKVAPGQSIPFRVLQRLINADLNGTLHIEALQVSNDLIQKVRNKIL